MSKKLNYYPYRRGKFNCPGHVRDLNIDTCYSGNGFNKCPYFVRYDWIKDRLSGYDGWLVCSFDLELFLNF